MSNKRGIHRLVDECVDEYRPLKRCFLFYSSFIHPQIRPQPDVYPWLE